MYRRISGRRSLLQAAVLAATAAVFVLATTNARAAITTLDLTTEGISRNGTANIGGGFTVVQIPDQSTGTGVISSFVRVQHHGNANSEQGYNTSLRDVLFDENTDPNFTRALLLSEIPTVTLSDGFVYRQFLLDIQQANPTTISLNQVQIFQNNGDRNDGALTTLAGATNAPVIGFGAGAVEVFRMSSGAADSYTQIVLDASLNSGSGSGDMFLYVLNSLFNPNMTNVILYSQFGSPPAGPDGNTSATFEEWSVLQGAPPPPPPAVPAPASIIGVAGALPFGILALRRRFRRGATASA